MVILRPLKSWCLLIFLLTPSVTLICVFVLCWSKFFSRIRVIDDFVSHWVGHLTFYRECMCMYVRDFGCWHFGNLFQVLLGGLGQSPKNGVGQCSLLCSFLKHLCSWCCSWQISTGKHLCLDFAFGNLFIKNSMHFHNVVLFRFSISSGVNFDKLYFSRYLPT